MRTLPLRLSPVDGESLPGYVMRYSHSFGLAPGDVVRALGLDSGAGPITAAGRYGVSLSAEQLRHAAFAIGIGTERLERMLLARYAGRAFDRSIIATPVALIGAAQPHGMFIWSSRFCPLCLRDDGAWRLRWQLACNVVCLRHGLLLVRSCPKCGTVPKTGLRSRWPGDTQGTLTDPTRCWRYRQRELCRSQLAAARADSVAGDPALLAAQRRIDELLDGDLRPMLAGETLDPIAYLHDVRALCSLLHRHFLPDERTTGSRRRPAGRRLCNDPATVSAVLAEALKLADLPDHAALSVALRELADRRYRADGQRLVVSKLGQISDPLRAALRRAVSETVWATASSRMGFHPRAHRRPDGLDDRLRAWHVPQLFWAEDYQRELAALFDFDDLTIRHGRRFCSVLLARMLTPLDWDAAVRYLDFPERFINQSYQTTFAKLRNNDHFDELAKRIKQVANQHAAENLVDYKQRRAQLADWTGINPETWPLLQPRSRPHRGRADNPLRRVHAGVWVWCQLTSGHQHAAPIALRTRNLDHHSYFDRHVLPSLRDRLLIFADLLLATPADARQTLPSQLAAALHEHGLLLDPAPVATRATATPAPPQRKAKPPCVDPLIADRVLAHVSTHTGVDIPSLTASSRRSRTPPAVIHARLLAAALLRQSAPVSWTAIATTIGGPANRLAAEQVAYRAAIERSPTLANELEHLAEAVANTQAAAPVIPTTPHRHRMHNVASTIRAHAAELLSASHGADVARGASIVVCREHTDLTWDAIAAIHDLSIPQPAHSRAAIARHRGNDPGFNHRYLQLLDHAKELQHAAGYAHANLTRGLTSSRQSSEGSNYASDGKLS